MEVKKEYKIGDAVWIHGVSRDNNKLTTGKVISLLDLTSAGYGADQVHYVISIPSSIEPLLEIRTWETMSQDHSGPIGAMRDIMETLDPDSTYKKMKHIGFEYDIDLIDEPTPDQIHAAIERSSKAQIHDPLIVKDTKPKRKFYNGKRKT